MSPYLYEIVPVLQTLHRKPGYFTPLQYWTEFFYDSFLPFIVRECNEF